MQTQPESIQSAFLEQLKKGLSKNLSFADELAELLNISRDSAYRRIRGETILSLDEVSVLTKHFNVSVDTFLSAVTDQVTFQVRALTQEGFTFEKWLNSILGHLEMLINSPEKEKELIYDSKDLPIFHYFQFPRLAAFKLFVWKNSFTRETKFTAAKYDTKQIGQHLIALGEKIWEKYASITSTEIIRYEFITVTLRQIEYLLESGMFIDKQEAINLLDDCSLLTTHLQQQARLGLKITHGATSGGAKFSLYLHELLIGGNTILFKMGDKRVTVITPNNFDLLVTTGSHFCRQTEDHINNLFDKSMLISGTAEKERRKFFNRVEEKIQETRKRIG